MIEGKTLKALWRLDLMVLLQWWVEMLREGLCVSFVRD
jgi:hypothetical protein